MFKNFFNHLESTKKEEGIGDGSKLVDTSYHENLENMEKIGYTSLLNENDLEWEREKVEDAKNMFELVKNHLPDDFATKPYEERMDIVKKIIESLG
jgi:hypothetical protein